MLKDAGSASVCPKCVSGQLNVAISLMWKGVGTTSVFPTCSLMSKGVGTASVFLTCVVLLNVAIANVDLDKAATFISL
jgi:hypothetical protein